MGARRGWLLLATILLPLRARAYFLDKARDFDVRMRAYSQLGILTDRSCSIADGCPQYDAGDLAQHRNFYDPEFDARLTDYVGWSRNVPALSLLAPDDFKLASRGGAFTGSTTTSTRAGRRTGGT